MRKIRLVTVFALVVLGLGAAGCSSAPKSESKATAKNSAASALPTSAPTSTTAVPSTVAPTSAPAVTTTSNPPTTTTTFVFPTTTTVAPKAAVPRVPHPRPPPKPRGPHRCPPGDVGKTGLLLGASVLCTHTATGYYWEPAP